MKKFNQAIAILKEQVKNVQQQKDKAISIRHGAIPIWVALALRNAFFSGTHVMYLLTQMCNPPQCDPSTMREFDDCPFIFVPSVSTTRTTVNTILQAIEKKSSDTINPTLRKLQVEVPTGGNTPSIIYFAFINFQNQHIEYLLNASNELSSQFRFLFIQFGAHWPFNDRQVSYAYDHFVHWPVVVTSPYFRRLNC